MIGFRNKFMHKVTKIFQNYFVYVSVSKKNPFVCSHVIYTAYIFSDNHDKVPILWYYNSLMMKYKPRIKKK